MSVWLLLTGKRKARNRPNQVLTSVHRPCRTVASLGVSDNAMAQVWLFDDAEGGHVPLPPVHLLLGEPADSPIFTRVC